MYRYGILIIFLFTRCQSWNSFWQVPVTATASAWAKTVVAGSNASRFAALTSDSSGNIYAVGYQVGSTAFTYGTGVSATGAASNLNALIVKYDANGTALWAKSVSGASGDSQFNAVVADGSGNIYAVGKQNGNTAYNYGSGVSLSAAGAGFDNAMIVKYDASGTTIWAKSTTSAANNSVFNAVAVDTAGNAYAAGAATGNAVYIFGASGFSALFGGSNGAMVKFNSAGTTVWGKNVPTAPNNSAFRAVAVDGSGNIYAAGYQEGTSGFNYDSGLVSGSHTGNNLVVVKYDATPTALWAKSIAATTANSLYNGVRLDSSGNVFAVGQQDGAVTANYGNSVTSSGFHSVNNPTIARYDQSGNAQWARSVSSGGANAIFNATAIDTAGNLYAVGSQDSTASFTYSSGVSSNGMHTVNNAVLVKYNSAGVAQSAKSVTQGSANSVFLGVAVDNAGNVYACGHQTGTGMFSYANGAEVAAPFNGQNALVVRIIP